MTWSWKSSLVEQRIYWQRYATRKKQDICIVFLDPHGDSVDNLKRTDLAHIYFDRLVYIDPFMKKWYTPCINPLEIDGITKDTVEFHAQTLLDVFEEMLPDAKLSNYMRTILKPCLTTMLLWWSHSLPDLQLMMQKKKGAQLLEQGRKSPIRPHKEFFQDEFDSRLFDFTKNSIYTKVQCLLNSPTFYNYTTWRSTIDLARCIRQGKILLFNLNKGRLGEEISSTIGRFIIAKIKGIALQRAKLLPSLRHLFIWSSMKRIQFCDEEASIPFWRKQGNMGFICFS